MTAHYHQPFFAAINGDIQLTESCVDIWQFPLTQAPKDYQSILTEEEIARGNRFYFPIHKTRNLAAHTTVRKILSKYLKIPADKIEFSYNKHGKPDIKHHPFLQFNLSHSGDLALLAITQNHSIGIDLEYFSARPYEGIGSHIFSENENKALSAAPDYLKPLGFFHLWSQKEALIKACGLGLSYPTKQLTLPLLPKTSQITYDELHQMSWKILSFMPEPTCCAAICYHPSKEQLRYKILADILHI